MATPHERLPQHKRTISSRTLDAVLEDSFCSTPQPPRPSTASTQTSFQSAFSSLEHSPFRYYLPHISTPTTPVYTKNEAFACNISHEQIDGTVSVGRIGRFHQYVPEESTQEEDVYTDGHPNMATAKSSVRVESKVLGSWSDFLSTDSPAPAETKSSSKVVEMDDLLDVSVLNGAAEVGTDVCSYTVGLVLKSTAGVGSLEVKKKRKRLSKKQQQPGSEVGVSETIKKMLRKLHLVRAGE